MFLILIPLLLLLSSIESKLRTYVFLGSCHYPSADTNQTDDFNSKTCILRIDKIESWKAESDESEYHEKKFNKG